LSQSRDNLFSFFATESQSCAVLLVSIGQEHILYDKKNGFEEINMKRATVIGAVTVLAILSGALAATAKGSDRDGPRGPRGMMEQMDFSALDADGDGVATEAEIAAFQQAKFDARDTDGNGAISAEEFTAARAAKAAERAAKMQERMISRLDTDGDGALSFEEMQAQKRGNMFERLDTNEDGGVSAEEFEAARAKMAARRGPKHDD
jgi:EF hand domain-containing protein